MASNNGKTALVVDDEVTIARLLKRILGKNGHTAMVCGSSLETLAATKVRFPS